MWAKPKAKRWQDAKLYEVYWQGKLPRSGFRKTWVLTKRKWVWIREAGNVYRDVHKMSIANFNLLPHWTDEKWQSMRVDWQEGNFKPIKRRRR
tara:strand:+ start:841 stop:1119 length:279 start_codon:yes stop_codon:yes gene_type:complete